MALGAVEILDWVGLESVEAALKRMVLTNSASAVFGVFPAPVQSRICDGGGVPCFAAWNGRRSVEGGVATFEHLGWLIVGSVRV